MLNLTAMLGMLATTKLKWILPSPHFREAWNTGLKSCMHTRQRVSGPAWRHVEDAPVSLLSRAFMGDKTAASAIGSAVSPYSRKNPFLAELIRHERLTQSGSEKDTRHFVLNLFLIMIPRPPRSTLFPYTTLFP